MSNPVLSQLATVEGDLSQQVESLESQLAAIQEQRAGLHTVIEMFQAGGGPGADNGTQTAKSQKTTAKSANSSPSTAKGKTSTKKLGRPPGRSAAKPSATRTAKTNKSKAIASTKTAKKTSANTSAKTARKKKKDGRAAEWQKYVQTDYKDAALPEAVSTVLRSQPSEVFTIADVMSSIFIEDMPRDDYLKARNRISNILSAGARDGTWYRGRNGRYAQTEKAR